MFGGEYEVAAVVGLASDDQLGNVAEGLGPLRHPLHSPAPPPTGVADVSRHGFPIS